MTSIDIDNPECSVCKNKIKKRKLFLPVRNLKYMNKEDACLCEDCFYRLPQDTYRKLISNADLQTGTDYNTAIIEALKKITTRVKLDEDFVILAKFYNDHFFEKFKKRELMKAAVKNYQKNGSVIIEMFENGKKIVEKTS